MTNRIYRVQDQNVAVLVQLARTTFAETFDANTDPADMAEFLATAYAPSTLLAELHSPGSTFWFIEDEGQVAGYLKLNVAPALTPDVHADQALELERIYILPEFKQRGLGSQLFDFAKNYALRHHKATIALGVWEHNEPAKAFYAARGFHRVGEHVFQVGSDPQRDWLMECAVD